MYETIIKNALDEIQKLNETDSDPRTKAIVVTKLQEAILWASKIYYPFDK